jgi:hypothetical protein
LGGGGGGGGGGRGGGGGSQDVPNSRPSAFIFDSQDFTLHERGPTY